MKSLLLGLLGSATAATYFKEEFGEGWDSRWVQSSASSTYGAFKGSHGKWFGDETIDMGVQTSQDAKFHSMSSKFESFSNKGKDLVIQFSVKHEQKIDCGGGYLKIGAAGLDQEGFNGESPYNIMFGPDICGATKKVHVIFNYKGENKLIDKTIPCETDELTRVYTLIVKPDQTYEVLVDNKSKQTGTLEDDWEFLKPKMILDPEQSQPADWDDRARIDDPEDVKPEGWDDIPEFLDDPEAVKPEDWDDEMDGDWEAPKIANPEFKGEWRPRSIENPNYQGKWIHPEIPNPEYVPDDSIYAFDSFGYVGIDIWQVKSGSVFDNIIITDSAEEASAFYDATTGKTIQGEKDMKSAADAAAREKAAAEAAAAAEEEEIDEFGDFAEEFAEEPI